MLQAFFQGAFELFFPDNCLMCRDYLNSRHTRQLCSACLQSIELNPTPFSRQSKEARFAYDQAWSAILYNDTAQQLLHAFKYNSKTSLRKTFVPVMIDFIDRHHIPLQQFDMITPIPLHPARLRERGYNQSALLSEGISRHYNLTHRTDLLIRQRNTHTQTELGAKQRWTNMEGAFRIKNPSDIEGKTVVLIDDLFTTGSTINSAAAALKDAGALRVAALTLSVTI